MATPQWIAAAGIRRAEEPEKPGLWTHPVPYGAQGDAGRTSPP